MRRILVALAIALVVLAGGLAVYVTTGLRDFEVETVTPDVHVLRGWGGNVAVLRTDQGAVVVDSMTFRLQGEEIRRQAEELGGGPVQALVNTHYHPDHTHGNPGFVPGTRVVSTERTLEHLRTGDADYWRGQAALALPSDTFVDDHVMRIGHKTIRSLHPGRGHTDGDLVTLFVEDRVLVAGDLLFRQRYPGIDLEAGGSIRAWIATLDRVMDLPFDRVVPGHGPTTDRDGLRAFQDFLRELWQVGSAAAAEGLSLEETLRVAKLTTDAGFSVIGVPFVFRLDRDFVVRRAWEEATGAVPVEAPGG
jgi:cyclase